MNEIIKDIPISLFHHIVNKSKMVSNEQKCRNSKMSPCGLPASQICKKKNNNLFTALITETFGLIQNNFSSVFK